MITVAAVGDVHMDQEMRGRYRPRLGGLAGRRRRAAPGRRLDQARHGRGGAGGRRRVPRPARARGRGARQPRLPLRCPRGDRRLAAGRGDHRGRRGGHGRGLPGGTTRRGRGERLRFRVSRPVRVRVRRTGDEVFRQELAGSRRTARGSAGVAGRGHCGRPHPLCAGPGHAGGEPVEIFPFLGSYLLAEAIDAAGAALAVHGHAHRGTEVGMTAGGVPVRNVALPVLGRPYGVYRLDERTTQPTR